MSTDLTTDLSGALADRYRIERELGAGGMATVYLAHDLKHDRKVALKVLKPELAAVLGAERFVVEIKTTAALQHPHILPLFDSGTADGFLYYVMPFIDGETLRAKLDRETQLGIDEAVRITIQIADALDYAHRHGVIHRDIKPENILLHDGRPMVVDFGIALAVSMAGGGRMTETGVSLGSPQYMSPEQATAEKEISARSDVYSLASVLYEMLAGEPPHRGGSAQQIIRKIIAETPKPVTVLRKSVPPNVAAAVAKALEKLPADRFDSARAFADALGNPAFTSSPTAGSGVVSASSRAWRERAAIPALAVAVVLAVTTAWALFRRQPAPPVSRYQVDLPEGKRVGTTQWSPMAVSPDGSKLVYMGETGRLFVLSRGRLDPVELSGTEGAFNPFFSRDGSRVGFMSNTAGRSEIKVASLTGGQPITVTSTGVGGPGAAWGYDGFIYFDAAGVGPLRRIRETGGVPEDASVQDSASGEFQHNWPDPLPNGRGVLMVIARSGGAVNVATNNDVAVLDLATHKHRVLVRGVFARYSKSGHILYVTSGGVLMAVPFDQDRMVLTGAPVVLLEGISVRRGGGGVDLTISESGTMWYAFGASFNDTKMVWASRAGAISEVDSEWTGDFSSLALSPDGKRVAVSIVDAAGEQIWVKQLGVPHGAVSKLTFENANSRPRWNPDGTQLLFVTLYPIAPHNVRAVGADGTSAAPAEVAPINHRVAAARWSPDGRWVVYEFFGEASGRDIAAIRPGVDSAPVTLVASKSSDRNPSISPDGRWLLYDANTTGAFEVYVRPFPNVSAGVFQISTRGGSRPKWSRDGREIFFADGNNELVRVAVVPGAAFAFTDQRVLFSLRGVTDWDVGPDQRFILIRDREARGGRKLVVVENVFQELKAKAPQ